MCSMKHSSQVSKLCLACAVIGRARFLVRWVEAVLCLPEKLCAKPPVWLVVFSRFGRQRLQPFALGTLSYRAVGGVVSCTDAMPIDSCVYERSRILPWFMGFLDQRQPMNRCLTSGTPVLRGQNRCCNLPKACAHAKLRAHVCFLGLLSRFS